MRSNDARRLARDRTPSPVSRYGPLPAWVRTGAGLPLGLAVILAAGGARAQQIDINPPLPNVMLLVDNSGSMERMIDGSLPEATPANNCNCNPSSGACTWTAQPPPNRWGVMLQALTGTFKNGYNCAAMPRTAGSVFDNEYQIDGVSPYDINYYVPFHRPILKDTVTNPLNPVSCVYAPGSLPGATTPHGVGPSKLGAGGLATDFPASALVQHTYGTSGTSACIFSQYQDGALDAELDIMRFGLMTFDQDPSAATGVDASTLVSKPSAFTGMWTYFPNWNTGGSCTYLSAPANCVTQSMLAVGARNPAAPPWEGRMVAFPATTDLAAQHATTANVSKVLLSSRPYGATPLAGMFTGAKYYFQTDPAGPQQSDLYVQGNCRSEYIILLTDGAPNLDLRPQCVGGSPAGVCPFAAPDTTAAALLAPAGNLQPVTTYVIGFAVSSFQDQGSTVYCSNLVTNGLLSNVCNDPTKQALYGACCQLQKIAIAGGTTQAYFADTPGDLQGALASILSQIAKNATTRTTPAYSPVTNALSDPNAPQTNSSLFLASFNPAPGRPWSGDVQRQRFVCTYAAGGGGPGTGTYSVPTPTTDNTKGDDFAANLNSHTGPTRSFVMLQPDVQSPATTVDASATIRPYVTASVGDGLGKYGATTYSGAASNVIASITPPALGLTASSCSYNPIGGGASKNLTASQCRDMVLDYTLAQQSFSGPADFPFVSRYSNAFGDIFHATPMVVGPPASLLRDDSYVAFRSTYASRKTIVYSATNDGLLHAFWADETKLENNEIWALVPPAVMPNLLTSYPASHQFLLDGSPAVKDVVWDRTIANQGDATTWHTMLVAGFGPSQRGYYALDVTNPDTAGMANGVVAADPPPKGPVFLWQLTNMPATNGQLFGAHSGTPAITSLFVDPGDGRGAREIGVAILPGGLDSGPFTSPNGCARAAKASNSAPVGAYPARGSVRCWAASLVSTDPVVGRSLSVVRLDTGEILRVFMRNADVTSFTQDTLHVANRIIDTPLDSPMTGVPAVFPTDVGTDATKVFIGDADGTIWRFDLSSPNPAQWFGEIYLDLYNTQVDQNPTNVWADGQPVELSPVVSLDTQGNVLLNVASGSQGTFDSTGSYYVYSISETVQGSPAKLHASVNWYLDPSTVTHVPGERVSGPMTVFDGVLYYATYGAPAGAQSCSSGDGRLWGRDFMNPNQGVASKGGTPILQAPGQPPTNPPPDFVQPDATDTTLRGVVIPGVSIKTSPACAGATSGADQYVFGAQHSSPQNFSPTPTPYSLFAQVGAKGSGGAATRQVEVQLPTPVSPTMIDSWAGVIE